MSFLWTTINVKNFEESLQFYMQVVGLRVAHRFANGPVTEIAFLGDGATKVELIANKTRTADSFTYGGDICLGFQVDSLEEKLAFVASMGVDVLSGPHEPAPGTRFFYVLDPNGVRVQFVEQK